jgi:hypothetical protein
MIKFSWTFHFTLILAPGYSVIDKRNVDSCHQQGRPRSEHWVGARIAENRQCCNAQSGETVLYQLCKQLQSKREFAAAL